MWVFGCSISTCLTFITAITILLSHGHWSGPNKFAPACEVPRLEFYMFGWWAMQCACWCQRKLFGSRQFARWCWYLQHTKYAAHQELFTRQYRQCHFQGIIHRQWLVNLRRAGWLCQSVWCAEWPVSRKIRPRFRYVIWRHRRYAPDLIHKFK